jgi:ATP-dependent helicase/nuclease subunit A
MKLSDYTIPQQRAITTSGSNIIVSAGAGSGKTQVLTQRVLYFVKNEGYKLENFLILTFTNLAAGEMKQRIRKTLLEEGLEEGNNVDVADITTFDSYALSLVKKYHFNLGISPNISIVDSNVISVRKRTLLNEIFETYYQSQDEVFLNMIKEFCFKDDDDIIDLTLDFYDKSMQKLDYLKYWDEFSNYYSIDNIIDIKNELLKIMIEDFKTLKPLILKLPNTCLKKTDERLYQDVVFELLEPIFNAETYEEILELLNATYKFPNIPTGSSEDDKKINTKIKNRLSDKIKKYKTLPKDEKEFEEYLLRNLPYARKIIEICKVLDSKIKEYKSLYEVYEFNDIAKMSLNLIKNNEDIRNEIKDRLKMIMIDEYQDTSIIQEEFISYIGNNNVYMVGDVKQSIYRFRNARSDIFTNKYNKYKLGIEGIAIDLNKNFRSRREVLDDINFIFKQIMTDSLGGANYRLDHVIEYGNLNYLKAGDNFANKVFKFSNSSF